VNGCGIACSSVYVSLTILELRRPQVKPVRIMDRSISSRGLSHLPPGEGGGR
jgi:hypothetical protein